MGFTEPDSVNTESELTVLLKWTRLVRLDNLSYTAMATELKGAISKSELARIFSGEDFPLRRQLNLFLDLCDMDEDGRQQWNAMWERLATARFERGAVTDGRDGGVSTVEGFRATDQDDMAEQSQQMALRVIDEAIAEAERIMRSARTSAEDDRNALIQEARATAASILARAADEHAAMIRNAEQRIAHAVDTAEGSLRGVIAELGSSVAETTGDMRRLMDDVRTSMADIRDDLASVRREAHQFVEKSEVEGWLDDARVVAPPVLGYPEPDYGPGGTSWPHGGGLPTHQN